MNKIIKLYEGFTKALALLSSFCICLMMLVTVVDIVMRNVFNDSLTGGTEIVTMTMVAVVYLAVGYTTIQRGQITVDVLKVPFWVVFVCNIICLITSCVFIYAIARQGLASLARGGGTLRLHIPNWPFMFITAFGFLTMMLSLIVIMLRDINNKRQGIDIGSAADGFNVDQSALNNGRVE
jgi:TRAP-type C4-dicarboxylate transport system permease small subunit